MNWKYLFLCLVYVVPIQANSQIGSINSIFSLSGYGFFTQDSNNYLYNEITNYSNLTHLIDSVCPFGPLDFYSNLDGITTADTITKLYGLHNQVPWKDTEFVEMTSSYSFNNKTSQWYGFYKKSWGDTNVAFLVIPGSGVHESIKIASGDVGNYHNMNGKVREKCLKYGDFYVYSKQNENFNSIWKNVNSVYQRLDYDYLTPYTDFNGNHWAANMYIDIVAAVKQLKKKYKKVIVMGLSNGGFPALICGLQGGADGINCAAGISSFSYNGFVTPTNDNPYFSNLLNIYTFDSIKGLLNQKKSEVLFSYGSGDDGGNWFEHYSHALEDTFVNQCNATFYYDFAGHTFPTNYYDTFFNNVIKQPDVTFNLNETICTADSVLVECKFTALPPISFNLYKNDVFVQSILINDTVCTLHLFDEGNYQLRNVTDLNAYPLCKSSTFTYTKDKKAIIDSIRYVGRNCSLQVDDMKVYFTGNTPFSINSTIAGSTSIVENNLSHTYSLPLGNYQIVSIQDSNNCVSTLNYPLSSTNDSLLFQFIQADYNCDSLKTKFILSYRGTAPWTLQYALNGQLFQRSSNVATDSMYIGIGLLNFVSLQDSTACMLPINQTQAVLRDITDVSFTAPEFSCDSNKMHIQFNLSGEAPWTMYYTKDAVSYQLFSATPVLHAYFDNGQYELLGITDASGCSKLIGQNYFFNTQPIDVSVSQGIFDCDSLKTKIHFELQGNPPFVIDYTRNSVPLQLVATQSSMDYYFTNGTYHFSTMTDSTNCSKAINVSFNINYAPLQVTHTLPVYNCSTNLTSIPFHFNGNSPFTFQYTRNASSMTVLCVAHDTTFVFDNGDYSLNAVTDAFGCSVSLTDAYTFNNDTLEMSMENPSYSCDSNKTKIHFNLEGNPPYTIYYFRNMLSQQLVTSLSSFDAYFDNANYFFYKIKDNTNCSIDTNLFYTFNFQPVTGVVTQQAYNCDSNKYQINFLFGGSAPWHLEYTDGTNVFVRSTSAPNLSLFLNNGNWMINKVTNDAGCIQYFNQSLSLSFNSLSASIVNQQYDCDSNKLRVLFALTGNAPWTIHYVKNGAIPVYLNDTTSNPNHGLYLPNGSYSFLDVKDSTDCSVVSLFQSAWNNYSILNVLEMGRSYNCDSNKVKVDYVLTGDGPWALYYSNSVTGVVYSKTSISPAISLYLTAGHYSLLSVTDTKCSLSLQDTLLVNFEVLSSTITPMTVSCDSAKYLVQFITQGGAKPYQYEYYYNGSLFSLSSMADTTKLFLPNGNYLLTRVIDSIGCVIQYNQNITANYSDFSFNSFSSNYLCNADSTQVTFDVTHQQAVWLIYTKNALSDTLLLDGTSVMHVSNGNYAFLALYDAAECVDSINQQTIINNSPVTFTPFTANADCSNKNYLCTSTLGGKSPWQLIYNYNNLPDTLVSATTSLNWITAPGVYYLAELRDANNCSIMIAQSDTLRNFITQSPVLQKNENQLEVQPAGYFYYWYKDLVLVDSSSSTTFTMAGEGDYYAMVKDLAGCLYPTDTITFSYAVGVGTFLNTSNINMYPNPVQSTSMVRVNDRYGAYWSYIIMDMQGHTVLSGHEQTSSKEFDVRALAAGVYSLVISYENNASKHVVRLIKE